MRAFLLLSFGSDMMYRNFDSNEQCQLFSKAKHKDRLRDFYTDSPKQQTD